MTAKKGKISKIRPQYDIATQDHKRPQGPRPQKHQRPYKAMRGVVNKGRFELKNLIDNNRHRCCTALRFGLPATLG